MQNNDIPEIITFESDEGDETTHKWMLTFADLLALLLAFFILLYSMSVITIERWENMIRSISKNIEPPFTDDQTDFSTEKAIERLKEASAMDLDYLSAILQDKLSQDPFLQDNIFITRNDERLIIRIATSSIFTQNNTSLLQNAELILFGVGNVLQQVPNKIEIYANSDDEALQQSEYPSHWELSLARAMLIGEMLKKFGSRSTINAFGTVNPTYGMNESEGKADLSALNQTGTSVVEIVVRSTVGTTAH